MTTFKAMVEEFIKQFEIDIKQLAEKRLNELFGIEVELKRGQYSTIQERYPEFHRAIHLKSIGKVGQIKEQLEKYAASDEPEMLFSHFLKNKCAITSSADFYRKKAESLLPNNVEIVKYGMSIRAPVVLRRKPQKEIL